MFNSKGPACRPPAGRTGQAGQSILEVVVASAVGILVVSALTFATIFSLRNANFAKNQAQATKLAQEGIEKVRSVRDRDGVVIFTHASGTTAKFSDLWSVRLYDSCNPCYFKFVSSDLIGGVITSYETLPNGMLGQVQMSDDSDSGVNFDKEKTISVVVKWVDFAGAHESRLKTILRRL